MSVGPIRFIYLAEVTVDASSGFVSAGMWGTSLAMTLTVEYLLASKLNVQGTFWLYGAFCAAGTLFVAFFVKETKGLTDKQIKELYRSAVKSQNEV